MKGSFSGLPPRSACRFAEFFFPKSNHCHPGIQVIHSSFNLNNLFLYQGKKLSPTSKPTTLSPLLYLSVCVVSSLSTTIGIWACHLCPVVPLATFLLSRSGCRSSSQSSFIFFNTFSPLLLLLSDLQF